MLLDNKYTKINLFTLSLFPFSVLVFFIMYLVLYTTKDSEAYLKHFSNPFISDRIEPGFQYYMNIYYWLGLPAEIGIVFTSIIIYILLARVWFSIVKVRWIESILLFNFIIFSLFNYPLGTSIRMGLAISLALYFSYKIIQKKRKYWLLLLFTPLMHYGISLYVLIFIWVSLTKKRSISFHIFSILIFSVVTMNVFNYLFPLLGLGSYYLNYLEQTEITQRIVPLSILFIIVMLFFIVLKKHSGNDSVYLLVLYSIPFLVGTVVGKIVLFPKMIAPMIFLSSIVFINLYIREYKQIIGNFRFLILFLLNILAILYALKMYQFY